MLKILLILFFCGPIFVHAALPENFKKNFQCATDIRNLLTHDPNLYIGYRPKPFFIFFKNRLKPNQPLVISADKTGFLTQPTDLSNGFLMDSGCIDKDGNGFGTNAEAVKSCPKAVIKDFYDQEVYALFKERLISAIKDAKGKLDADIVSMRNRSERFPPSAGEVGMTMRSYLDGLKKCSDKVTDADIKSSLNEAITSIGTPPDEAIERRQQQPAIQ